MRIDFKVGDPSVIALRLATTVNFVISPGPGEDNFLVFQRRVQGKFLCALLRRQNARTSVTADFSELATSLRQARFSNYNPSTIEWREITVTVVCNGATRYAMNAVRMHFADGRYINATKIKADDAQLKHWSGYVELAVQLALRSHVL